MVRDRENDPSPKGGRELAMVERGPNAVWQLAGLQRGLQQYVDILATAKTMGKWMKPGSSKWLVMW